MALAIVDYATYIDLLRSAPLELVWRCVHVLAAVVYLLIAGVWLPGVLFTCRGEEPAAVLDDAPPVGARRWALWLALAAAGGVISSVTFWTISLFVFKQIGPGHVGVITLAVFGLVRAFPAALRIAQLRRDPTSEVLTLVGDPRVSVEHNDSSSRGQFHRPQAGRVAPSWLVLPITCVAFGMGLWQVAATELPTGDRVWLCDRHRDLSVHMHATSVIAASGLPRLNLTGFPDEPFSPLSHTGYAALTAGFSQITGISLYQAFASLWIAGYLVISWSSLALVGRFHLSRFACFASAIAPLIWAQAGWPAISVMLNPSAATTYPEHPYVAAMMYHNFPHVWSIALVSAGLICLDLSSKGLRKRTLTLSMASLAFVISGWIKPSQVILFGPALLIVLVLNRRRAVEFAVVLFVLAWGLLVYFLPAFLEDLPSHPSWSVSPSREKFFAAARFFVLGLGAGLIVAVARLRTLWRNRKTGTELDWADAVLIAAGGGCLFAFLFTEERFGSQQPNIWWGVSGCLTLFSPYVIAWCARSSEMTKRARRPEWLRRAVCCVVGVQVLGGLVLAATYPLLNLRSHRVSLVKALQEAGRATPAGTTFYADPGRVRTMATTLSYVDRGLTDVDLVGYLDRPVLYLTAMSTDAELDELRGWRAFVRTGDARFMKHINRRGAVILHASRSAARTTLLNHGWVLSRNLPGNYELFESRQPTALRWHRLLLAEHHFRVCR